MSKLYNFCAAILCIILFSCKAVSFEPLRTRISVDEKSAYFNNENIELIFSIAMKTQSVENNITLKSDSASVETDIIWKNNSCLVKPVGGFCLGKEYSFSLIGDVTTQDGRTYPIYLIRKFIFGTKENVFCITKIIPPSDKNVSLCFYFNKALDIASFEQQFQLSPYIETKKEYSFDKTSVYIVPSSIWQNNTFYSWKIQNAFSADKYRINKTYSGNFIAVDQTSRPEILSVCPTLPLNENLDVSKAIFLTDQDLSALFGMQPFGIIFSKPMNFESLKNALHFTPSIVGVLLQKDETSFVYVPYENYKIKQKYLLQVEKSAKDIFGLEMPEQRNFYFTAENDFLKIVSVTANEIELIEKQKTQIKSSANKSVFIQITFSSGLAKNAIDKISKSISLNAYFPNTANPPKLNSIKINETQDTVTMHWQNLSKSDAIDYIYVLKILGGKNSLCNSSDEYMEEDKWYYLTIK